MRQGADHVQGESCGDVARHVANVEGRHYFDEVKPDDLALLREPAKDGGRLIVGDAAKAWSSNAGCDGGVEGICIKGDVVPVAIRYALKDRFHSRPMEFCFPYESSARRRRAFMRTSRYGEHRIIGMLREHAASTTVADLRRHHGVSQQTLFRWKQQYGGLETSELRRLKQLEAENAWGTRLRVQEAGRRTCTRAPCPGQPDANGVAEEW